MRDFVRLRFSRDEADAITRLVPAGSKLRAVDFAANRLTATSAELSQYRIRAMTKLSAARRLDRNK